MRAFDLGGNQQQGDVQRVLPFGGLWCWVMLVFQRLTRLVGVVFPQRKEWKDWKEDRPGRLVAQNGEVFVDEAFRRIVSNELLRESIAQLP